jgi:hypothetical protein
MTPADLPPGSRRPVRLSITLPLDTYDQLRGESRRQGRSLSNLAAHLLAVGLATLLS